MSPRTRKLVSTLLLALVLPMLLSGCWEREELNEMSFVLGMGVDKAESGYKVTYQVVIPSAISSQSTGGGGGAGVPVVVTTVTVPTLYEAEREYSLLSSRSSYSGHIRVLVIGEELARSGIGRILDVLQRSREPRKDFYMMVAKGGTAEDVLKVLTPLDKLPANKLFNSLDKSFKISSRTVAITLKDFIEDLLYQGMNPVLTGVEVIGSVREGEKKSNVETSDPPARLQYHNIAVFRKDKMIGWLDDKETIGYNYVTNKVVKSSGPIEGDDGQPIVIEALRTTTKRKVKLIGGEPHIYIHVKALCNVQEVLSTDNLESEQVIRKLEQKSEERIISRMKAAVTEINDRYNVDIMGFGQSIYRAHPQAWTRLQQRKGDGYLKSLSVHYAATVDINRIGLTDRSFIEDIKE